MQQRIVESCFIVFQPMDTLWRRECCHRQKPAIGQRSHSTRAGTVESLKRLLARMDGEWATRFKLNSSRFNKLHYYALTCACMMHTNAIPASQAQRAQSILFNWFDTISEATENKLQRRQHGT